MATSDHDPGEDLSRIRRERDLYRRLLNLGHQDSIDPFLRNALALVVEITQVQQGYIELADERAEDTPPRWWMAHGFSTEEIAQVRAAISTGIIAEALATGRTVVTPSALLDPRFKERESVRIGRIEAVLCTPIGKDPPRGVLYLQGRASPGLFIEEERRQAELFAHHIAPCVDRLLSRRWQEGADPTREFRAKLPLEGVIGRSPALAAVLRQVAMVAPLKVNVLLTGQSGTGKSQLAKVIHKGGPRSRQRFLEVNCGALPEGLFESELFGALPGAHSTALRRMPGKIEAADHGTLFLDEISALPMPAQAKLLQFLQSKEYYPLGANKPVEADVRVIAATNADLDREMREGRFREDLLFRLKVVAMRVPSLAERREDIPALAAYLCKSARERHGLPRLVLSQGALRAVEAAEWPGNIRELGNALESAAIVAASEGANQIEPRHLFPDRDPGETPEPPTFQQATRLFQARLVEKTLRETEWNIVETARRLDVARSHVYNLIHAFGIERDPT